MIEYEEGKVKFGQPEYGARANLLIYEISGGKRGGVIRQARVVMSDKGLTAEQFFFYFYPYFLPT